MFEVFIALAAVTFAPVCTNTDLVHHFNGTHLFVNTVVKASNRNCVMSIQIIEQCKVIAENFLIIALKKHFSFSLQ